MPMDVDRYWFARDVYDFWQRYIHEEMALITPKEMYSYMNAYAESYWINKVDQMKILKIEIIPKMREYLQKDYSYLRRRRGHSYLELREWAEHDGIFEDLRQILYAFLDNMEKKEESEKLKMAAEEPLKRFVRDAQNVHTGFIAQNTNQTFEALAREVVPEKAKTLDKIMNAWSGKPYINYNKLHLVYEDMKKWGNTATVSAENDYAYRKALRSAVAKIMGFNEEVREELWKRLWEETLESLGMCAQGHLSRIANVFVGFDLSAVALIPPRELFQNEISVVATSSKTAEEKALVAKELMAKYAIPREEQQVWLDAVLDV